MPRGVVFASQPSQITALVETKRAEESEKFFGVSDFRPKQSLLHDLWIDRFLDKSDDTTSRLSCSLGSNSTYHNDSLC